MNSDMEESQINAGRAGTMGDAEVAVSSAPMSLVQSMSALEEDNNGPASEFSGLVSYFSSQHDDFNT